MLDDKISYPDESFMDLEFKISVMYDIAKVSVCFIIYAADAVFYCCVHNNSITLADGFMITDESVNGNIKVMNNI